MIPFRDENPTRTFPFFVVVLVAANVVIFLYQSLLPDLQQYMFVYTYGAVPAVLLGKVQLGQILPAELQQAALSSRAPFPPVQPTWLTIFTSMFLHGSFLHLAGNMLYLWIFGNNVEDALGHARFLTFYLFCGLLAAAAQILLSTNSPVPMIGASGAIAGVLGAYYQKFPHARVRCLVFILFFITVVALPAGLVLLIWFLLEVLRALEPQSAQGGVAVFAHIGGFIAGYLLVRRFEPRARPRLVRFSP
jgi:membrane associated rhomboid family serine protease